MLTPVYILNGTENEDRDSPMSPFQGKTLSLYFKNPDGTWASVLRDSNGLPKLGYLAKEISETEASKWNHRIAMAAANPKSGYIDSEGHWFPGRATSSVLTLAAWNAMQVFLQDSAFMTASAMYIDRLADDVLASNHPRSAEYAARYQEAIEFAAHSNPTPEQFPYLHQLRYKGLSLADAAKLVIDKYTKAEANDVVISDLRMRKALLTSDIPLQEKKEIYRTIVEGLRAARV